MHWEATHDDVTTSQLSWQLGFGPRTTGWLARPAGSTEALPGVLETLVSRLNRETSAANASKKSPQPGDFGGQRE